ncbi:hypothetical protein pEaSNUABM54_00098 [Erwinia phage pEa_SNUABM_54]|nr:hypothetical protein pEaSNUABM54_00098 [Erwinia phage pEa_SNUABM_54]
MRKSFVLLLALLGTSAHASGWQAIEDKREVHYRVMASDSAMLDIGCSANFNVILGTTFITSWNGSIAVRQFEIDDKVYPNYFNPGTPAPTLSTYNTFWNAFRSAKEIVALTGEGNFNIPVQGIRDAIPSTDSNKFICRPVDTKGVLVL